MPRKVLVVESERRLAERIRALLTEKGFEVCIARNGEEGLWKSVSEKPHAVILGARLPFVSGWALCREIKGRPDGRRLPVIVLTSPRASERAKAFLERCDACFSVPPDPARLVDTLNRLTADPAGPHQGPR